MNKTPPPGPSKRKYIPLTMLIQPLTKKERNISISNVFSGIETHGHRDNIIRKPCMELSGAGEMRYDIKCESVEIIDEMNSDMFAEFINSHEETTDASMWNTESNSMRDIKFQGKKEVLVPITCDPYDTFRLILTDELLDFIVRETNMNAQKIINKGLASNSGMKMWTDLSRSELITFLGLILHMGTIRQTQTADYWKTHYLFNIPCFSKLMKRNRFRLIFKCITYSSDLNIRSVHDYTRNKDGEISTGKSIIDFFNKQMQALYSPGRDLIIDDSVVLWTNQIYFRDDIKNKALPGGARLCVLGDTEGIAMKIRLCGGPSRDKGTRDPPEKVVLGLLENKLDLGHCVYMDGRFNSYDLAAKLLNRDTYCTGTLRKNSKNLPKELVTDVLNPGESKSLYQNGVHVGKWKQRLPVLYLSTEYDDVSDAFIKKSGEMDIKPSAVIKYRQVMSKVKLQDLMVSYYPLEHQRIRWYIKLFFHILQMSLNNAYLLHTMDRTDPNAKKISFHQFRLEVLERMLPCPPNVMYYSSDAMRAKHVLSKIKNFKFREKMRENGIATVTRECVRKLCQRCRENNRRTGTSYECQGCDGAPGYCVECFCAVHLK